MKPRYHQLKRSAEKLSPEWLYGFTKKECLLFIIFAGICALLSMIPSGDFFAGIIAFVSFIVIFFLHAYAKKRMGRKRAIRIEHEVWSISQYGLPTAARFKKPVPLGVLFPLIVTFLSGGFIKPLLFFQFKVENIPSIRLLKAHGDRRALRKELIHEADFAFATSAGFFALLGLSVLIFLLFVLTELTVLKVIALYPLYYSLWNMIPLGNLDGSKLFFGSVLSWSVILFLQLMLLALVLVA
jgi:hypothetical protein